LPGDALSDLVPGRVTGLRGENLGFHLNRLRLTCLILHIYHIDISLMDAGDRRRGGHKESALKGGHGLHRQAQPPGGLDVRVSRLKVAASERGPHRPAGFRRRGR